MAFSDTLEQLKNFDVNDIDFERIGVWPLPGKIFVCVLLVVVVFALTYYLKVKDLNTQLDRVVAEETNLRQTFETKSFQAANLEEYRAQMVEMEKSFGALLSRLPSDTEVPGLLEDIDARGSESGLDINSIRLESEQQSEYYVELPISIDVEGGYHDLGTFVSGVAGMPRIVTLHNFTIARQQDSGTLTMQIGAKTYRYKSQDESSDE
ncbi:MULTISPECIES: type 4a pilus biogenesis protein PilO [Marinimicrobium]|jgi:type IV pilus assembly protein PilO|uniref:Type IV pilus assembly protein PilO n=1 Tax=Marinimicrobium koreense TaxID=306545 RepID=A0A3N1P9G7_9GAMM|nr:MULTISPECIES: type 4a pilus biogenesis protein PilO [Marinimicrobium]MAN52631.1 pilus assembly protein PilP [Marinimicrobium sp.]ROQ21356.1 type IV pilus assembly protein PilO [Marinimicrobium koreense]